MNNQKLDEGIETIPIQEKIKAVTEIILEGLDLKDIPSGMAMGFIMGILTSTSHPEWAVGIREWLIEASPPGGSDTLDKIGSIYVNNIPLERRD